MQQIPEEFWTTIYSAKHETSTLRFLRCALVQKTHQKLPVTLPFIQRFFAHTKTLIRYAKHHNHHLRMREIDE